MPISNLATKYKLSPETINGLDDELSYYRNKLSKSDKWQQIVQQYGEDSADDFLYQKLVENKILKARQSQYKTIKHNVNGELEQKIRDAAKQYGVPEELMLGLAVAESRGNPKAGAEQGGVYDAQGNKISSAIGLFAYTDSTAAGRGIKDRIDPDEVIPKTAQYLSELQNRYGSPEMALLAFARGRGYVENYIKENGVPPEAQWNLDNVMGHGMPFKDGGARGKFGLSQDEWDNTAKSIGANQLVGRKPSEFDYKTQKAVANRWAKGVASQYGYDYNKVDGGKLRLIPDLTTTDTNKDGSKEYDTERLKVMGNTDKRYAYGLPYPMPKTKTSVPRMQINKQPQMVDYYKNSKILNPAKVVPTGVVNGKPVIGSPEEIAQATRAIAYTKMLAQLRKEGKTPKQIDAITEGVLQLGELREITRSSVGTLADMASGVMWLHEKALGGLVGLSKIIAPSSKDNLDAYMNQIRARNEEFTRASKVYANGLLGDDSQVIDNVIAFFSPSTLDVDDINLANGKVKGGFDNAIELAKDIHPTYQLVSNFDKYTGETIPFLLTGGAIGRAVSKTAWGVLGTANKAYVAGRGSAALNGLYTAVNNSPIKGFMFNTLMDVGVFGGMGGATGGAQAEYVMKESSGEAFWKGVMSGGIMALGGNTAGLLPRYYKRVLANMAMTAARDVAMGEDIQDHWVRNGLESLFWGAYKYPLKHGAGEDMRLMNKVGDPAELVHTIDKLGNVVQNTVRMNMGLTQSKGELRHIESSMRKAVSDKERIETNIKGITAEIAKVERELKSASPNKDVLQLQKVHSNLISALGRERFRANKSLNSASEMLDFLNNEYDATVKQPMTPFRMAKLTEIKKAQFYYAMLIKDSINGGYLPFDDYLQTRDFEIKEAAQKDYENTSVYKHHQSIRDWLQDSLIHYQKEGMRLADNLTGVEELRDYNLQKIKDLEVGLKGIEDFEKLHTEDYRKKTLDAVQSLLGGKYFRQRAVEGALVEALQLHNGGRTEGLLNVRETPKMGEQLKEVASEVAQAKNLQEIYNAYERGKKINIREGDAIFEYAVSPESAAILKDKGIDLDRFKEFVYDSADIFEADYHENLMGLQNKELTNEDINRRLNIFNKHIQTYYTQLEKIYGKEEAHKLIKKIKLANIRSSILYDNYMGELNKTLKDTGLKGDVEGQIRVGKVLDLVTRVYNPDTGMYDYSFNIGRHSLKSKEAMILDDTDAGVPLEYDTMQPWNEPARMEPTGELVPEKRGYYGRSGTVKNRETGKKALAIEKLEVVSADEVKAMYDNLTPKEKAAVDKMVDIKDMFKYELDGEKLSNVKDGNKELYDINTTRDDVMVDPATGDKYAYSYLPHQKYENYHPVRAKAYARNKSTRLNLDLSTPSSKRERLGLLAAEDTWYAFGDVYTKYFLENTLGYKSSQVGQALLEHGVMWTDDGRVPDGFITLRQLGDQDQSKIAGVLFNMANEDYGVYRKLREASNMSSEQLRNAAYLHTVGAKKQMGHMIDALPRTAELMIPKSVVEMITKKPVEQYGRPAKEVGNFAKNFDDYIKFNMYSWLAMPVTGVRNLVNQAEKLIQGNIYDSILPVTKLLIEHNPHAYDEQASHMLSFMENIGDMRAWSKERRNGVLDPLVTQQGSAWMTPEKGGLRGKIQSGMLWPTITLPDITFKSSTAIHKATGIAKAEVLQQAAKKGITDPNIIRDMVNLRKRALLKASNIGEDAYKVYEYMDRYAFDYDNMTPVITKLSNSDNMAIRNLIIFGRYPAKRLQNVWNHSIGAAIDILSNPDKAVKADAAARLMTGMILVSAGNAFYDYGKDKVFGIAGDVEGEEGRKLRKQINDVMRQQYGATAYGRVPAGKAVSEMFSPEKGGEALFRWHDVSDIAGFVGLVRGWQDGVVSWPEMLDAFGSTGWPIAIGEALLSSATIGKSPVATQAGDVVGSFALPFSRQMKFVNQMWFDRTQRKYWRTESGEGVYNFMSAALKDYPMFHDYFDRPAKVTDLKGLPPQQIINSETNVMVNNFAWNAKFVPTTLNAIQSSVFMDRPLPKVYQDRKDLIVKEREDRLKGLVGSWNLGQQSQQDLEDGKIKALPPNVITKEEDFFRERAIIMAEAQRKLEKLMKDMSKTEENLKKEKR